MEILDLSWFNTENVTDMDSMFKNCSVKGCRQYCPAALFRSLICYAVMRIN
ncbi:MAG: hypothetical protein IJP84_01735 [Lachnospiraceae bacterium]|nr:hypothetical protein [Lachnospiraceae bacterium]